MEDISFRNVILTSFIVGFSLAVIKESESYNHKMFVCGAFSKVEEPPIPPYPYKHKHLPIMGDYKGKMTESYWKLWKCNPYSSKPNNWISWNKLKEQADLVGYGNKDKLRKVEKILTEGAELGCKGTGRLPSRMANSLTVAAAGSKVADTLQDWIMAGIMNGPFKEEELPFPEVKISPLSVRPKPGGKIRLIVDLSAPHGVDKESSSK